MENVRSFQAAVALRSLVLSAIVATSLAIFGHRSVSALALVAGTLIGLAYLFHIATAFNRLTKAGKGYLPLLAIESLLRVLIAGAAPFVIIGRGPAIDYFLYLAGFVAPLAVAILTIAQQIKTDSAKQSAAT